MAYEKRVWVNNQTKVSATNLNHIEEGLSVASVVADAAKASADASAIKAETAQVVATSASQSASAASQAAEASRALAVAAQTTANAALDKANDAEEALEDKQDKLNSGENIKTINGQSLLGAGNIVVASDLSNYYTKQETNGAIGDAVAEAHEHKATAELNKLLVKGAYEIDNATDHPTNTAAKGILVVKELEDGMVYQDWQSDTNRAVRITDGGEEPVAEEYTLVVKHGTDTDIYKSHSNEQKEIELDAGFEYEISGELAGRILIGTATEVTANSKIKLNGINIKSTYSSGIEYLPTNKTLTIELLPETNNKVVVSEDGKTERTSTAAIYSADGDFKVTGTGALFVHDAHGHGFKSSELIFNGKPTVEVTAGHDAFHASKILRITDGLYKVNSANDAFSAGTDSDTDKLTVEMTITGGDINIVELEGSIFEGKSTRGNFRLIGTKVTSTTDIGSIFAEKLSTNKFKVYKTCTFTGLSTTMMEQVTSREVEFDGKGATAVVRFLDGEEPVVLTPEAGVYTLDQGKSSGIYDITGDISNCSFVITAEDVDINLKGVYADDTSDSDTALFDYTTASGRLQLNVTEGYVNYLSKKNGKLFSSASNLSFKTKDSDATETTAQKISIMYLKSENGTVIDASDGRSAVCGDGIFYIRDSKVAVDTVALWLGNEYSKNGVTDWGKANISMYIDQNETDAIIRYRESSKGTTDTLNKRHGYITAPYYLLGTALIGNNIEYIDTERCWIEARVGVVDTTYTNTAIVYCSADSADFSVKDNVKFFDAEAEFEEPEEIVIDDESTTEEATSASWHVYDTPEDVVRTADLAAYVKKTVYDAKVAEMEAKIKALTPKTVTFDLSDENISKATIYKYYGETLHDLEPIEYSAPVLARDGDFGYPCVDGTGQINFMPTIINGYETLTMTVTPAGAYNKIKAPDSTEIAGLYRITKITDDITIKLTATNYNQCKYILDLPEEYVVAEDKSNLPAIKVYVVSADVGQVGKGTELIFAYNTEVGKYEAVDYLYNKDTGLKCLADGDVAQLHFTVSATALTTGYAISSITPAGQYNKFEKNATTGEYKATKVKSNIAITIKVEELPTHNVTYVTGEGAYTPAGSATVLEGSALAFEISHENNPAAVLNEADSLALVDSVLVGTTDVTDKVVFDSVESGKKKAKFSLPGQYTTGDITITTKASTLQIFDVIGSTNGTYKYDGAVETLASKCGNGYAFEFTLDKVTALVGTDPSTVNPADYINEINSGGTAVVLDTTNVPCTGISSKGKPTFTIAGACITGNTSITLK